MAEPAIVTREEFHEIFGSSDEEGDDIDPEGSDIEVEKVDSDEDEDEDEDEEDVQENDNGDNVADAIGEEPAWSNVLSNFVINQFNGQPGIKVEVPEEATSDFFFNLIFGYEMVDLIVREQKQSLCMCVLCFCTFLCRHQPNSRFFRERDHTTVTFSFSFPT